MELHFILETTKLRVTVTRAQGYPAGNWQIDKQRIHKASSQSPCLAVPRGKQEGGCLYSEGDKKNF